MKLRIVDCWDNNGEKILENYSKLNETNCTVETFDSWWEQDKSKLFINVETIEDLQQIQSATGQQLVVDFDTKEVTIYNGYVE